MTEISPTLCKSSVDSTLIVVTRVLSMKSVLRPGLNIKRVRGWTHACSPSALLFLFLWPISVLAIDSNFAVKKLFTPIASFNRYFPLNLIPLDPTSWWLSVPISTSLNTSSLDRWNACRRRWPFWSIWMHSTPARIRLFFRRAFGLGQDKAPATPRLWPTVNMDPFTRRLEWVYRWYCPLINRCS